MNRVLSRITFATATAMLVAAGVSLADDKKAGDRTLKGSDPKERAAGVIVKVEKQRNNSDSSNEKDRLRYRLTINTAAVWRDWARDQDKTGGPASTKKAAREGNDSVATKGEPKSPNTLVVVDVQKATQVETRFREMSDETGRGSANPPADSAHRTSAKPVRFAFDDLKEGLYVEVDFQHRNERNPASRVTVLRPIEDQAERKAESPKSP